MNVLLALLLSVASAAPPAKSAPPPVPARHVPPECAQAAAALDVPPSDRDREWNVRYARTWDAAEAPEPGDDAVAHACEALALSAGFDARDWRFAETLDELGLLHFERGDFEASARAQGMAAAEMLLAKGPSAPEVALFVQRLGMPMQRLGRGEQAEAYAAAPHRLLVDAFVPHDAGLAERLEWLIAEEMRVEDMTAARELRVLADRLRGEAAPQAETR